MSVSPDLSPDSLVRVGTTVDVPVAFTAEHETMLREVHGFCTKLAAMLDGMAENPMIAAMLPPGIIPSSGG